MDNNQTISLKRDVLVRIIKAFLSDDFLEKTRLIPFEMRPKGTQVPYRCCIYKERAVIRDRIISGLGFAVEYNDESKCLSEYAKEAEHRKEIDPNPLTLIDTACKGCTPHRVYVTPLCKGCVARPCQQSCKFGAITIQNGMSTIDNTKCKYCKMCISACPYNAIVNVTVPCEDSCPVGAIKKSLDGFAQIDYSSCISCGKCVINCPFGAVHEKSQIIDILKEIKNKKKVIGLIAPSIAGQFCANIYQLKSAMLKAGFADVYEVAQGADETTCNEAKEFREKMAENKSFMTTSCCSGYHQFIKKHFPEIKPFVSDTKTPLYYIARKVKKEIADAITVFVGPCVAKKIEARGNENVNFVTNYEEISALFIAKGIDIAKCSEEKFDIESSKQGRGFGVSGGVCAAVAALVDKNLIRPYVINGLNKDTIRQLIKMAKTGKCEEGNLVEVMCCEGGCIGGNATIEMQKTARKNINALLEKSSNISEI
ncbi:MAG: monomeric [FeFe] hydrogenase [Elusimicrobiota bacterium]|jgi:[FeFe] hydrogenase (group B1/B3)|nr:monomeric [FeFe] hydrogenase [Elusimicrobiota bacterium]